MTSTQQRERDELRKLTSQKAPTDATRAPIPLVGVVTEQPTSTQQPQKRPHKMPWSKPTVVADNAAAEGVPSERSTTSIVTSFAQISVSEQANSPVGTLKLDLELPRIADWTNPEDAVTLSSTPATDNAQSNPPTDNANEGRLSPSGQTAYGDDSDLEETSQAGHSDSDLDDGTGPAGAWTLYNGN